MEEANIGVLIRIHPSPPSEDNGLLTFEGNTINIQREAKKLTSEFSFSAVLGPTASQAELYGLCSDKISGLLNGINTCILAYGQTGSGKVVQSKCNTFAHTPSCDIFLLCCRLIQCSELVGKTQIMMTRLPLPTAVLLRTSSTVSSHEPSQISSPLSKQQVAQRTTSPSLSIVSSCRYTTRRYMISSETRREVRLHHMNAIACSIVLCFLKCIQLYRKCARHPRECPWLWLEHRCACPRPLRVPRAREGRCHGELQHTRTPLTTDSRAGWLAALKPDDQGPNTLLT